MSPAAPKVWGDPGIYLMLWSSDVERTFAVRLITMERQGLFQTVRATRQETLYFIADPSLHDWVELHQTWLAAARERKPDFVQPVIWNYRGIKH